MAEYTDAQAILTTLSGNLLTNKLPLTFHSSTNQLQPKCPKYQLLQCGSNQYFIFNGSQIKPHQLVNIVRGAF